MLGFIDIVKAGTSEAGEHPDGVTCVKRTCFAVGMTKTTRPASHVEYAAGKGGLYRAALSFG